MNELETRFDQNKNRTEILKVKERNSEEEIENLKEKLKKEKNER